MSSPLNPALYSRLQAEFGRVQIAHEGCSASIVHHTDAINGRTKANVISAGEYYRVNCPFCGDGRGRLWINHLWGVRDEVTGSKNLWLAVCYNEGCLSESGRPYDLYERLFSLKNANLRGKPGVVLAGEAEPTTLSEVELPGIVLRLDKMPPNDPVCTYLRSRELDPAELGRLFEVSYCVNAYSNYPMAHGRLVIPIIMDNIIVGWQCRYVGDIDFKTTGIPKYYSRPMMPRRLMLYNFDNARRYPYVVICEGPTDTWNVGPQAVATFGKHLSAQQINLIGQTWGDGAAIILLDGDAWEDTQDVVKRLQANNFHGPIIPVRLPPDKDPGSLNCTFLWEYIGDVASKMGIDLLTMKRDESEIIQSQSTGGNRHYPSSAR